MDALIIPTLQSVFRIAAPEAMLVLFACVVFLGGAFKPGKVLWGFIACCGLVAAGVAIAASSVSTDTLHRYSSVLWPDSLALYTRVTALVGAAILMFVSWDELPDEWGADYFASLLVLTAGVGLVGSATELITMFLALELVSIPTYVMMYLPRHGKTVQESAVKYFVLSIFSSALVLFGFSYLYGVTGTTNIPAIHDAMVGGSLPPLVLVAAVMIIAGLGFRITAVPFHFYAPDVYEGSANGPAAMLAFIPKVVGFVALIRLYGLVGPGPLRSALIESHQLPLLFWILAAITMTVGNIVALWQDNVKRLLAYSGIAHAGYMLIGLAMARHQPPSDTNGAVAGLLFYLLAYGAMTIGAFAVLQALSTREKQVSKVDELAGLGTTHPGLAMLMALFLFSMIGLPLTAGFSGKLQLFFAAVNASDPALVGLPDQFDTLSKALAIIAAINAAIGAYYYLRLVGVMYLRGALKPLTTTPAVSGLIALWACAGLTVWLGVYPLAVREFAAKAAKPPEAALPRAAMR